MANEDVEEPISIHISKGDAHIGYRIAKCIVGNAALRRLLRECSVALIDKQPVRHSIIRDEDVGPVVSVEVRAKHAQPRAGPLRQARNDAYIFKSDRPWFTRS